MNPILLAAWIGCQVFDSGSTALALRQPTLREGNPLGARTRTIKIAVNVGALVAYATTKHRVIPISFAAAGCTAGVWNVHQIRTVRP